MVDIKQVKNLKDATPTVGDSHSGLETATFPQSERLRSLLQNVADNAHWSVEDRAAVSSTLLEFHKYSEARVVVEGLLADRDPAARIIGVRLLKDYPLADAAEKLTELLGDKDPKVRTLAIEALVNSGISALQPVTRALILGDRDIREAAFNVLEQLHHPASVSALEFALDNRTVPKVSGIPQILSGLKDKGATGILIEALYQPDSDLRLGALEALGKIGSLDAWKHITNCSLAGVVDAERVRNEAILNFCQRHNWLDRLTHSVIEGLPSFKRHHPQESL